MKLKPCPFCGSEDITVCRSPRGKFWAWCPNCVPGSQMTEDTELRLIENWNRRAEPAGKARAEV